MNTTTSATARSATPHPPDTLRLPGRTARTTLPDRLAMRVALALVLWSTRPEHAPARGGDPWRADRRDSDRVRREQAWLALARHTHPY